MKKTLIIPCGTDKLGAEFAYDNDTCSINCVRAISEMDIRNFDEIYFVILSEMDEKYHLTEKITADMNRILYYKGDFEIIRLGLKTNSPAETIYKALLAIGTDRSIFIKDADAILFNQVMPTNNAVIVASLEDMELVNTMHKSYLQLDEQGFITNCIERRVISDKFIAGGYFFENAEDFVSAYEALKELTTKFYVSDIIFWLILNKNSKFLPVKAQKFKDFNF